jgi:hypothetical protein
MRSHDWIDRRSLALHEAVAAKLQANPQLLNVARENLERWLNAAPRPPLIEWRHLLDTTPLPELLAFCGPPTSAEPGCASRAPLPAC